MSCKRVDSDTLAAIWICGFPVYKDGYCKACYISHHTYEQFDLPWHAPMGSRSIISMWEPLRPQLEKILGESSN